MGLGGGGGIEVTGCWRRTADNGEEGFGGDGVSEFRRVWGVGPIPVEEGVSHYRDQE